MAVGDESKEGEETRGRKPGVSEKGRAAGEGSRWWMREVCYCRGMCNGVALGDENKEGEETRGRKPSISEQGRD